MEKMKRYLKSRAAVVTLAAATALSNNYSDNVVQAPDITTLIGSKNVPDGMELLTVDELKKAYEKVKGSRDVYGVVSETRQKIKNSAAFLIRWAPGMVETKLAETEKIGVNDLETMGIEKKSFAPLVDLGVFDLTKLRNGTLNLDALTELGTKEIVIMEDRSPKFFLNYDGYKKDGEVPLNRHGNTEQKWQMEDLKKLVDLLHQKNIKVVIGFWGNTGDKDNNPFVRDNWENLKPVVPTSDDVNPLSFVKSRKEKGKEIPFADYVTGQYQDLKRDFGFDGLFLGDGLMGFRSFLDPDGPYDFSEITPLWTDFYKRVYGGVKRAGKNDTLWAYDCMANGAHKARRNGLDLQAITPYVDNYIFQSYGNDAWGSDYMNLPGYDVNRDAYELATLPEALKAKARYSVGLGDSVEQWKGKKSNIKAKHALLRDNARKGTLGVWSNDMLKGLL